MLRADERLAAIGLNMQTHLLAGAGDFARHIRRKRRGRKRRFRAGIDRQRAVIADQRRVDPQLLHEGPERAGHPARGKRHDRAVRARVLQGADCARGELALGIEQRAVHIEGDQFDGQVKNLISMSSASASDAVVPIIIHNLPRGKGRTRNLREK